MCCCGPGQSDDEAIDLRFRLERGAELEQSLAHARARRALGPDPREVVLEHVELADRIGADAEPQLELVEVVERVRVRAELDVVA